MSFRFLSMVMAYYLDIGMLLKQTGLIDFLIVNGCQHNIFHAVINGFFKLLDLLHCALWSLRSNVDTNKRTKYKINTRFFTFER